MKKEMMIVFVFIFINLAYAQEIEFNYPDEVSINEEFKAEIILSDFDKDVYDVKIDISGDGKRISQIKNQDNWQSTFNYINDAIDTNNGLKAEFNLRIAEEFIGNAEIIVKIRNSNSQIKEFSDYGIKILAESDNSGDNESEDNNEDDANNNNTNEESAEIFLEFEWDEDEIINGEDFDIKIKAFNLEEKTYDVRLWIEFKNNDTVISDRYDEEKDEWKSGQYYISGYLDGPGNKTEDINLRIREDFEDFNGDANIFFKLRDGITIDDEIKILERETDSSNTASSSSDEENENSASPQREEVSDKIEAKKITGEVIKLNAVKTEDIKTLDNIIYESKTEQIKKYSIYGFALLCAVLCVLLYLNKLKW